jgi:rod shape-determining protein MreB
MLKHFLAQVSNRRRFFRPRVMVCVPSGVTSVEKRAVIEACGQAGARETFVIEEPLAAALGVGIDITEPSGSMLVDIGGGTTDVAVLSLGGIVVSESLRVGGDRFDEALMRYVKREHNMLIGERTAEELKIEIGTACPDERDGEMDVRGRDLVTGLPKTITVTARETFLGMSEPIMAIVDVVKHVLERTPPELAADIADKGIVMTGGGAKLHGFDTLLARATNTPTHLAEDPLTCVVLGAGRALENYETLQDHVVVLKKVM